MYKNALPYIEIKKNNHRGGGRVRSSPYTNYQIEIAASAFVSCKFTPQKVDAGNIKNPIKWAFMKKTERKRVQGYIHPQE